MSYDFLTDPSGKSTILNEFGGSGREATIWIDPANMTLRRMNNYAALAVSPGGSFWAYYHRESVWLEEVVSGKRWNISEAFHPKEQDQLSLNGVFVREADILFCTDRGFLSRFWIDNDIVQHMECTHKLAELCGGEWRGTAIHPLVGSLVAFGDRGATVLVNLLAFLGAAE